MLVTNASEFVQAISEIKEGGEITLQPGEYRLREPLHIRKSLTISGTGYEETVIVFEGKSIFAEDEGKCGGIKFSGEGMLSIRDVSIRYAGADEGCDVITAVKGDLRLTRCFISGGVGHDDKKNMIGTGVWIHKTSQAVLSGCIIADNEVGIGVSERAKARIELSKILSNAEDGILIGENASSEVRHCEISNNGIGILASDESRLVARSNTCEENQWSGIALFGSAQGEVSGNACRNNGYHGIAAHEQSRLVARNNTCEGNQGSGIALFGSAQGEVEGNRCVNNRNYGIYVHERSVKAVLRNNTVYGNPQDIYDPRR
jgi:parallel beta-helix repeat protein